MRRDMDTVRSILVTAEGADGPVSEGTLLACAADMASLAYHVELMRAHGLITAEVEYDGLGRTPLSVAVTGITWEGYDYLDAIRSPRVWAKSKSAIAKAVGDTSLSVVKETCQAVAKALIMSQLGLQ